MATVNDGAAGAARATAFRKSLGVMDGIAIAASSTAATTSIGVGLGVVAAVVGLQMPVVLLLAFVPILGIASGYARLNRVEPNCGNSYVWVGRSLSPWLGFLTGWMAIVAVVVFMAYTTAIAGSAILQLGGMAGVRSVAGLPIDPDSTLQSTLLGLTILGAVTFTAVRGVAVAARLQKYLLVFEYVVLIGFCAYGLFAGSQPFSLSWFNPFAIPSFAVLAQGMVIAVFFYWGFEAAFSVSEEVRDSRDASRAGVITVFLVLGLFLLGAVAFQRVLTPAELADNGTVGLAYLGETLADQPLAALPVVALMFSVVASLQATVIPSARGLFAMGRDRTLGPVWTRIHSRYGTPAAGTVLLGGISAVVALLATVIPKLSDLLGAGISSIGLVVALWYGLTALAAAVRFRGLLRVHPWEGLRAVVFPALSALVLLTLGGYLGWIFYTSADHLEVSATNGWFQLLFPVLVVISGLMVAAHAKWVRRSPYFVTGRGTDADDANLLAGGTPSEVAVTTQS
ncbi:APC family permease [Rhodococcus koreensis]|uniref:APC family permease n=1 Tax=Rhodococcus koreensis TaxID=99653 RepID=UPI0019802FBA|nr:APC family permease [Rhodococcus koreensis]QSE77924.1 APC family permease [Rhodococcus koreensis]